MAIIIDNQDKVYLLYEERKTTGITQLEKEILNDLMKD